MALRDQFSEHEMEIVAVSRPPNDDADVILAPLNVNPLGNIPIPPMVISNLQLISQALAGGAANVLLEQAKVRTANLSDANKTDLNKMKEEYGLGLCTQLMIANRTRWPIELVDYHNFSGVVWKYPVPTLIERNKVGTFIHVRRNFRFTGSSGALSYALVGPNGPELRLDVVWQNPSIGYNWVRVRLASPSDPIDWHSLRFCSSSSSSKRRDFETAVNNQVMLTACIGQSTSSFLEIHLREKPSASEATEKN